MDYFFHADTTKYRRRLRGTAIIVLVPLFGVCVFCAVNILLNLGAGNSSGILKLMALVIVLCVLAGTSTIFRYRGDIPRPESFPLFADGEGKGALLL